MLGTMTAYQRPVFAYRRSPDQDARPPRHHAVVVAGAGPVGLVAAIDLAQSGVPVVVLDEDDTVSAGSRAVCYSRRTLEILDRLGCGSEVVDRGIAWAVARVFRGEHPLFGSNLDVEGGQRRPPFVNLQQYHLEEILVQRAEATGRVDLRWRNRVIAADAGRDRVTLRVETPNGPYELSADWLIACDGCDSAIARMLGEPTQGRDYRERFLAVDIAMRADYPAERRFWFDPPFHSGQSALLHRQSDDVWRVDLQLGPEADPDAEARPETVRARLSGMLGGREFELMWIGVRTFAARRLSRFRAGRVLFAGDAAHQLPPFGAAGANSGIQDADNLVWKLKLVMEGKAPERLLDTYSAERVTAAEENLRQAMRSAEFITPKSRISRVFRDAALDLSEEHAFARRLVNSGRLLAPACYSESQLNTADADGFASELKPGAPANDALLAAGGQLRWMLDSLGGRFAGLYFAGAQSMLAHGDAAAMAALAFDRLPVATRVVADKGNPLDLPPGVMKLEDLDYAAADRYDGTPGTFYLFRPDQHVCARWRRFDVAKVRAAIARATCNEELP